MASSTSSLSRHRPVILVVTGAAAAFAAYYIYTALQTPSTSGLHRSNAVRRAPRRVRRHRQTLSNPTDVGEIARLILDTIPTLGSTEFLGHPVALDATPLPTAAELRQLARTDENPDRVASATLLFYETFIIRLLYLIIPERVMPPEERHGFEIALQNLGIDPAIIPQAFRRYYAARDIDRAREGDDRESMAGTEVSWHTSHESGEDQFSGNGQTLKRTLYHIAEERARQEGVKHRGVSCDQCDAKPIRGIRWRCVNCADFDLCSDCEATNSHTKTHIFYKIRIPAPYLGLPKQAPVYPGRPNMMPLSIDMFLKRRLITETNIEAEEIEALWDQFTCLADTEWRDDPNEVGWAIDRRSFNQAFIPRYSTFTSAPNLIYDRVFAYYDSNNDGKIGYEEFVKGLDGMHSSDPAVKLRIVFSGYDIDDDGYISRKDVLRLFRAYYAIEKEGTRNYIAESTDELSVAGALDVINSGQPLASQFTHGSMSSPRIRRLHGKTPDRFGDLRSHHHGAVLDDTDDTAHREDVLNIANPSLFRHGLRRTDETSDPVEEVQEGRTESVRERWRRRRFYVDEEEGLNEPEGEPGSEELSEDQESHGHVSPNNHENSNGSNIPRGSRSSSRVRFQDDLDVETRSNASTSSRPFGERWGGYEVPEPEKDLGKEILYQITQQAFNELLDPLFLEKENLAMEAFETKQVRRELRYELDDLATTFEAETRQMPINGLIWSLGSHGYSRRMVEVIMATGCSAFIQELKDGKHTQDTFEMKVQSIVSDAELKLCNSLPLLDYEPSSQKLWNAKLWRIQFKYELSTVLLGIFFECGWLQEEATSNAEKVMENLNGSLKHLSKEGTEYGSSSQSPESASASERERSLLSPLVRNRSGSPQPHQVWRQLRVDPIDPQPYRDPTMPQFRPNSEPPHQELPHPESPHQDPTMPQFRPNSIAELQSATTTTHPSPEAAYSSRSSTTSDYTTPEEGNGSDTDDNTGFIYQADKGPFFFFPESLILTDSNKSNYKQLPDPVPTTPESIQAALETPVRETAKLSPVLFSFSFDPPTLKLEAHPHPFELPQNTRQRLDITLALRRSALKPSSPCYLSRLANLDAVDKEIQERKGQGLISYDEFMALVLQDGKLRFLEAWMDWVNF